MEHSEDEEQRLLRSVALQNAQSILLARQRADAELVRTKDALERKTEELARSLAMVRATLELTTDAILVTDAQGRVTDFNEKFVALWQAPRELLTAREHEPLLAFLCGQHADPAAARARIDAIYASDQAETFEVLELKDKRVLERVSRTQVLEKATLGRVWSFRDITDRKRTEEALLAETRDLELLNQTGTVIASQLELQPLVQAVTDAATQLCGAKFGAFFYTTRNASGDELMLYTLSGAPREAFERFGHPRATALFGPTFRGDGPVRSDDVTQDPRYGHMTPHHGMPRGHLPVRSYLAVSVKSRRGEILGGLFFGHPEPGVFTARSERIIVGVAAQAAVAIDNARLFQSAQEAIELRDEFLSIASHELRTPLTPLTMQIQSLKRFVDQGNLGALTPARLRNLAATSERQILRLTSLIDHLLDVSRISSGRFRIEPEQVDLVGLVKQAVDQYGAQLRAAGCTVQLDAPDKLEGQLDPLRIEQAFINLLTNAIKYAPGKPITLTLRRHGESALLAVEDQGIGIADQDRERIFQRYERVSSSANVGGLGLGLFITRQIAEAHGGTLGVESLLGRGSTFTLLLPLAPSQASRKS